MTLFAVFCGGAGFVLGVVAVQVWKKKTEEPDFMRWAARKHLQKLKPSEEQWPKIDERIQTAVDEALQLKARSTRELWDIIERAADGVNEELTPEQRQKWEEIRPKRPAGQK